MKHTELNMFDHDDARTALYLWILTIPNSVATTSPHLSSPDKYLNSESCSINPNPVLPLRVWIYSEDVRYPLPFSGRCGLCKQKVAGLRNSRFDAQNDRYVVLRGLSMSSNTFP